MVGVMVDKTFKVSLVSRWMGRLLISNVDTTYVNRTSEL